MKSVVGKFLALAVFFLAVVACAKPTYVSTAVDPRLEKGDKLDEETACGAHFQKSGYCVGLDWEAKPSDSAAGIFLFKSFRPNLGDESPIPQELDGIVSVRLFMPSMGHGSSPIAVEKVDVGTYRASGVFFSMHGHWQIIFETKQKNGTVVDKAVLPFTY